MRTNNILKRKCYDWVLEIVALLGLSCILSTLFFYGVFSNDEQIPIHFNSYGEVDGWGKPYYLLFFVVIGIIIYIALGFTEKKYRHFNYPFKLPLGNVDIFYRLGVRLIRHLKALVMLFLGYLNVSMLLVILGKTQQLNMVGGIIFLLLVFGVLIFFTYKMFVVRNQFIS